MSAAEDDTELRDLLIQNLENSGVLNKLKAEMRAAVFLAMEEQDRLENKTPLINENLKKCLNTKDGRLVASLMLDFLQVFHLDFTLAVFQPEINSLNGLDGRDVVCRELDLSDLNRNSPLLLELIRRGRHKHGEGDRSGQVSREPSQKQIAQARKNFDFYDKDGSGSVPKEDLKRVFIDLFPSLNKNMLETFISDELRASDRTFSRTVDFQLFLGLYKRLYADCRTVVLQDSDVSPCPEERLGRPAVSKIPTFKGHSVRGKSQAAAKDSDGQTSPGKGDCQQLQGSRPSKTPHDGALSSSAALKERLDLDDDPEDGDSFFDDPLPEPQKTYGWKVEESRARESPAGSLSETQRPGQGAGGAEGGGSVSEQSHSRIGVSESRERSCRDPKAPNEKSGSQHLDDVEYDDDFNSHRSDLSKSELSIGEEIEEVSIEGPENSDKFDETTQDLSVSQLSQSHGADYMEDVA